jgi:hypothetical protein
VVVNLDAETEAKEGVCVTHVLALWRIVAHYEGWGGVCYTRMALKKRKLCRRYEGKETKSPRGKKKSKGEDEQ